MDPSDNHQFFKENPFPCRSRTVLGQKGYCVAQTFCERLHVFSRIGFFVCFTGINFFNYKGLVFLAGN